MDEAVRYIKELEMTLANKVINEGSLILPGIDLFQKTINEQVIPTVDDRSSLPLETPVKHSVIAADAIHLSKNPVQLRNFVSHFVITPRQRLAHECNEILQAFHETTISENTKRLDRE